MSYHNIQAAGFIYGPQYHHLEMLGTLCSFLDIPLIVTDSSIAKLASRFFPMVVVFEQDYQHVSRFILENYPYVVSGLSRMSLKSIFFLSEKMTHKHLTSIWCPHPSILNAADLLSDELFSQELALMIEGDKIFEGYVVDKAFPPSMQLIKAGCIRRTLYESHKPYYQKLLLEDLKKTLNRQNVTLLYAPMSELDPHFHLETLQVLLKELPSNVNLIVLQDSKYPLEFTLKFSQIAEDFQHHDRVFFLQQQPFTYALLDLADILLGDFSSLAFDYLYFNKPLFLLDSKRFAFQDLGTFATVLSERSLPNLYKLLLNIIPMQESLFEEKKLHYLSYFTSTLSLESLKQHVDSTFRFIQFQKTP